MAKMLKAEMWDKMQYLFRNFYDRMVHCVQYYDGLIDIPTLKRVLVFTTEKVPVLHSAFRSNVLDPYWEVMDYTVNDILTVRDSIDLEADINSFICQSIPVESNVQYKMAVFNHDGRSVLCMIVNHMCMDGGDFKYFMKKLAENYNKLLDGDHGLDIKTGSRSYDEVYSKLTPEEEEVAKGLYKNISQVKDEHYFPLTPSSPADVTRICRRKVGTKLFSDFRKIGKALGVTVNDLMLAFYVRSLYEIGMFRDDERLTIPCMVDLRRHIVDGGLHTGLTNHTGFMQCSTERKGETINDTLIEVLRSVRKSKDDPYMGLYSLPLLKLAYSIFPYVISEQAIKIGYLNPLIGMSNIGVMDDRALKMGDANIVDGFMTPARRHHHDHRHPRQRRGREDRGALLRHDHRQHERVCGAQPRQTRLFSRREVSGHPPANRRRPHGGGFFILCRRGMRRTCLRTILFGAFAPPKLDNMYTIAGVPPEQNHPKISCSEMRAVRHSRTQSASSRSGMPSRNDANTPRSNSFRCFCPAGREA